MKLPPVESLLRAADSAMQPDERKKSVGWLGWVGVAAIAGAMAVAALLLAPREARSQEAWEAGKIVITEALKTKNAWPSDAVFPSANSKDTGWKQLGKDRWQVWGYFDQKANPAIPARTQWRTVIDRRNGRAWEAVYIRTGSVQGGDPSLWQP